MLEEIHDLLRHGSTVVAIEHVERDGDADAIASRYADLATKLYWKAHDVPALVALSRAGIRYALLAAATVQPDQAETLRGKAKQIAFNLGSFTWPGWNEPWAVITAAERAAGHDAAALNLHLALQLRRGAAAMAAAWWLVGAHELAAGRPRAAVAAFQRAGGQNPADADNLPMNAAYVALAALAEDPMADGRRTAFEAALHVLAESKTENGRSFAEQVRVAGRVFAP